MTTFLAVLGVVFSVLLFLGLLVAAYVKGHVDGSKETAASIRKQLPLGRSRGSAVSALEDVLEELAERVAAKVLARMAAPTSQYGTGRAATLPPGKTRAWTLRTLKTIPGARQVGRDWVVSVSDFDAWSSDADTARISGKPFPRATGKSHGHPRQNVANDVDALAEQALSASGFRRVRSAR